MPEVVWGDLTEPGRPDGRVEDHPAPVAQPQCRARSGGQHQVPALLALAARGQRPGQPRRQRHAPVLMGLRCTELELGCHLGDRFRDGESAAPEIDAAHPQGGQLAEPQAGVGQQSDDVAVVARYGGEAFDLFPAEEPRLVASDARDWDPVGGVPRDASVAHGQSEQQCEHAMRLTHGGRSRPVRAEVGDPAGDLGMGDVGEPVTAPGRQDVSAEQTLIAVPGARLDLGLR